MGIKIAMRLKYTQRQEKSYLKIKRLRNAKIKNEII